MANPSPTPKNLLQRGADPYADVAVTNRRTGVTQFSLNGTEYDLGTLRNHVSAFQGKVRELRFVVDTLTAGASVVTLSLNGNNLAQINVPAATPVGTTFYAQVNDDPANKNAINIGDVIKLQSDGVATAGSITGLVWVDAGNQ